MPPERRQTVLVAGATGYVGQRLVAELLRRQYAVRALVRKYGRLAASDGDECEEVMGDVLDRESLAHACRGCDAVVSCVGGSLMSAPNIQEAFRPTGEGNLALFQAARAAGASRFVMISSLNSAACRDQFEGFRVREEAIDRIMELTEQDAHRSGGSGIAYTIVEPSGFFKDYERIFRTVQCKRRASSLGDGFHRQANPIDGADLAARIADTLARPEERNRRIAVGGPDILTLRQIVLLAASAAGVKNIRYKTVPMWAVRLMMGFLRLLSLVWSGAMRYHAIAQFITIISTRDSVGERCGTRHLADHFKELAEGQ